MSRKYKVRNTGDRVREPVEWIEAENRIEAMQKAVEEFYEEPGYVSLKIEEVID